MRVNLVSETVWTYMQWSCDWRKEAIAQFGDWEECKEQFWGYIGREIQWWMRVSVVLVDSNYDILGDILTENKNLTIDM